MAQGVVPIPGGVAVPATDRLYVSGADGGLEVLDAATGTLLGHADVDAVPITAAGTDVVAVRAPTADDPGEIVLVDVRGDDPAVRWRTPLIEAAGHADIAQGLTHVDIGADVDDTVIRVVADAHARYRGGAHASDERIEAARRDDRHVVVVDRGSGEVVERTSTAANGTAQAAPRPGDRGVRPTRDVSTWEVVDEDLDQAVADVTLDAGTDAAALVGDTVVYRVNEPTADGASVRHTLRSRAIDSDADTWTHPLGETRQAPRPPLPP
jgi:hypothetical protein